MKSDIKSNSYTYIHKMLLIEGTNFHGAIIHAAHGKEQDVTDYSRLCEEVGAKKQ